MVVYGENFKDDPDKEFRVEVKIPAVTPRDGTLWARLCSPDAGKGRGFFFRPEVGDEVVVGFLKLLLTSCQAK